MAFDIQVTFDCADPTGLAAFWVQALGYAVQDPPPGFTTWDEALEAFGVPANQRNSKFAIVDPEGKGPRLFFQQVPEGKTVKNRVHLDVRAAPGLQGDERMDALEKRAADLETLGAKRLERREPDMPLEFGHLIMADPEGNEFCLD